MEFLTQYGLFLAQAVTIVVSIVVVAALLVSLGQRQRHDSEGHIEVRKLNDKYADYKDTLQQFVLGEDTWKQQHKETAKQEKKAAKAKRKKKSAEAERRNCLYVLNFDGDIKASATDDLREEISAVLGIASEGDEVLVKLESGGGMVHSYGLASSQLQRLTDAGVSLTIAVDKVAASGGYMMACVANRIVAAPFAVIGSIGVLAQLPNFHRLLGKANVDFEQLTAGEYKRTLTMFGENTDEGRSKMQEELEETHVLFKEFVARHRRQVDIDHVATGEVWYGERAVEHGLVDELKTSDSYVQEKLDACDVFEIRHVHKKNWQEKLGLAAEGAVERGVLKLWQKSSENATWRG